MMKAPLLLGAALIAFAAPTLAGAQDADREQRRAERQAARAAAEAQAPAAAAAAQQAAPAPQAAPVPRYIEGAGNIHDRRQLFTGPNDPAATPQDRAQLWNRGPGGDRDRDGIPNRFDRDRNGYGRVDPRFRDRDRDGIPDRFDRDRNGDGRVDRGWRDRDRDGIPNRFDRDRDGDGIPNRFDNRPNQRFRGGWYAGDRRAFNYNGRTFYRFRADPYRWSDARYQNYRWSRGSYLPRFLLIPDYFVTDYYAFGVQPAPYGYQWVRVGYDLLLVNEFDGRIVDVVPGAFYW